MGLLDAGSGTIGEVKEEELPEGVTKEELYAIENVTEELKGLFKAYTKFDGEYIVGEVASKSRSNQALYLTLTQTEGNSELKCILWKDDWDTLDGTVKKGAIVAVSGKFEYYEGGGRSNIVIDELVLVGESAYQHRINKLRADLKERGVLAPEAKQPLPAVPKTVGVVTAAGSDAEQDIIGSIREQHQGVNISMFNTVVQGEGVEETIAETIKLADEAQTDVLVISRGGGSDLALRTFDKEPVVEAVVQADTPTVAAVGHDSDTPLVDDVADTRVATPTAVGAEVVIDNKEYTDRVEQLRKALTEVAETQVCRWVKKVDNAINRESETHTKKWRADTERSLQTNAKRLTAQWLQFHQGKIADTAEKQSKSWIEAHRDAIQTEASRLKREREIQAQNKTLEQQNRALKAGIVAAILLLILLSAAFMLGLI